MFNGLDMASVFISNAKVFTTAVVFIENAVRSVSMSEGRSIKYSERHTRGSGVCVCLGMAQQRHCWKLQSACQQYAAAKQPQFARPDQIHVPGIGYF